MTGMLKEIYFDGSNYTSWAIRMEFYLLSKGLWSVVEPEDMESRRRDSEWKEMNQKARGKIGLTLHVDIAKKVRGFKTALEMWHYLKDMYADGAQRSNEYQSHGSQQSRRKGSEDPLDSAVSSASTVVPLQFDDVSMHGSPSLRSVQLQQEESLLRHPQQMVQSQSKPQSLKYRDHSSPTQPRPQLSTSSSSRREAERETQREHERDRSRDRADSYSKDSSSQSHHQKHHRIDHIHIEHQQRGRSRSLPDIPSPDGSVTGSILSRASSPQGSINDRNASSGDKKSSSSLWSMAKQALNGTNSYPPSAAMSPSPPTSVISTTGNRDSEYGTSQPSPPSHARSSHSQPSSPRVGEWWLMTTAPHHMCKDREAFIEYEKLKKPFCISFPDGTHVYAIGKGSLSLTSLTKDGKRTILTKNVYYVPDIRKNVLSVASTVKLGNSVEFGDGEATLYTASRDILATAVMDPKQNGYRLRLATTSIPRNDTL